MDKVLAKKLKQAGLFQGSKDYCNGYYHTEYPEGIETIYYHHTLEELIEACGEDISHIKRLQDGNWWAVTHTKFDEGGNNFEECGSTPIIAVAQLYLALKGLKNGK